MMYESCAVHNANEHIQIPIYSFGINNNNQTSRTTLTPEWNENTEKKSAIRSNLVVSAFVSVSMEVYDNIVFHF